MRKFIGWSGAASDRSIANSDMILPKLVLAKDFLINLWGPYSAYLSRYCPDRVPTSFYFYKLSKSQNDIGLRSNRLSTLFSAFRPLKPPSLGV